MKGKNMELRRKNHLIIKVVLDIVMALLLVLLYNKRTISMSFHEMGGLCVFGLFLIHKALNWRWIKGVTTKLFRKETQNRLRIAWIVDALLLVDMTILIVTGLMISKTFPIALPGGHGASSWHYFAAAWSIILVGIHLGFHWNFIRGMGKKVNILPKKFAKVLGSVLLTAALLWGGFSLVTGSFSRWITSPFLMEKQDRVPEGEALMYGDQETGEPSNFGPGKGRNAMNGNGNRGEYKGRGFQGKTDQVVVMEKNIFHRALVSLVSCLLSLPMDQKYCCLPFSQWSLKK